MSNLTPPANSAADWSQAIMALAARQDREAFARLFAYFAPRIKTYMRRSGASEGDAEDLAQEALLMVWRKAALFDPANAGASTWIFTIARNLRVDAMRRKARGSARPMTDAEAEFALDEAPLPDLAFATRQGEKRVRSALAALSADQQRVVELSFFEDKAHGEIAGMLGIPLGTVKSRLRLAMAKLRDLLGNLQ
jgi:RNA polymerase sigma-70 factor, ECF subfamily